MAKRYSYSSIFTESELQPQEEVLAVMRKKKKLFIGIPKELAFQENRVALVPASVATLIAYGHRVVIEKDEDIKRLKVDVREATDKYANIVEALKNDNQKELQRMKSEDSQIIAHIESESTRAMQALEEQLQVCKEEIEELKAVQQAELNHMSEKQQGEMGEYAQVKV